ncbi:hypothetical protein [Paraburkholderia sp. EG304]|uniref:hypothetical protein n=1 Tax=Paraburkholderia sp. EG304 TaxID=3237015 RepID=UPI00397C5672
MTHREQGEGVQRDRCAGFTVTGISMSGCSFCNGNEHTPELAEHKLEATVIHFSLPVMPDEALHNATAFFQYPLQRRMTRMAGWASPFELLFSAKQKDYQRELATTIGQVRLIYI